MAATISTRRRAFSHRQKRSIAHAFVHAVLVTVSAACALPLLLILAASFTEEAALVRQGFRLIPAQASLDAYRFLFNDPAQIVRAYGVSTFVTVVGASVSLFLMSMLAYALSRRDFALRQVISFFIFFPALFSAGMVPFYILMVRTLGLKDNILALILPPLVIPFFVLLLRTYFSTIPKDLIDAARIDGASEFLIYFRVVLPLSTPALATVGLFSLLFYWNDLYLSLLFINDRNLYNLLNFGIEGKHWEFKDKANKLIGMPAGVTNDNVTWLPNTYWQFGDRRQLYLTDPTDIGVWGRIDKGVSEADVSPVMGFTFNRKPVEKEIAQVNTVAKEYEGLNRGRFENVDAKLAEYKTKLKEAGIDKIIAEMQKQIDEWAATLPK